MSMRNRSHRIVSGRSPVLDSELNGELWVANLLRTIAWRLVKGLVERRFPEVPRISTEELANWLASDRRPDPVLIDVRQAEEYAVSHLPQARHLTTVEAIQQAAVPQEATLVLYCSVGYRSARLAEKLQAAGYSHVMNLEGSIFEWYNQGHPVVAEGDPVSQVHPYSRTWGLLLASSRQASQWGKSSGRSMSGKAESKP